VDTIIAIVAVYAPGILGNVTVAIDVVQISVYAVIIQPVVFNFIGPRVGPGVGVVTVCVVSNVIQWLFTRGDSDSCPKPIPILIGIPGGGIYSVVVRRAVTVFVNAITVLFSSRMDCGVGVVAGPRSSFRP